MKMEILYNMVWYRGLDAKSRDFLLDTHVVLWAIRGSNKNSQKVQNILKDAAVRKFVSPVIAYEISYKYNSGKLNEFSDIAQDYFGVISQFRAFEIPISSEHMYLAGSIDWAHRDPFNRILAAQAHVEGMVLITRDSKFNELDWLKTLW